MNEILLFLAVLVGIAVVLLLKPSNKIIRLLLSFSGAYLLSVTILHLLPEVFEHTKNTKQIGIIIIIGILIQSILESFSKGAEHGHLHIHAKDKSFPWLLFISLCVHSFSEGVPIHSHEKSLLWAIVIHKIPIAIVLTSFFIHANYSKKIMIIFLSIFSLMSPLGLFLADKITFFTEYYIQITAFIIGVFLHISTVILFESSENHKFNLQKFIAILLGMLLTVVTL